MSTNRKDIDYKDTLNLPKTKFPMKANLTKKEPEMLKFWKEIKLYEKLLDKRKDAEMYILHDGPPYANGHIHIGTAFNKILKDFIPKYKWMKGYKAPYVPGWDTHGLPIEHQVLKTMGKKKEDLSPVELREKCMEYALNFIDIQREEFKRLGVLGDWDNPYITLKPEYEAVQIGIFREMVEKEVVYRGKKTVYWCVHCETALAAAEIEYYDETSPSIYVKYKLLNPKERFKDLPDGLEYEVIIWTTTPWTLPASMAIAVHPEYEYVFVRKDETVYLLAKPLLETLQKEFGWDKTEILKQVKGKDIELLQTQHPFYERKLPIVLATYVTLDQGTGCVHTAPAHGIEDYETGIKYGLYIKSPVNEKGFFEKDTELVGGLFYEEANQKIIGILKENNRLIKEGKILHSYPHCWRCKKPVIFRATEQWFVAVSKFREDALNAIDSVKWIPQWGKERIYNMVKERSDWCISRQRVWGVPIPAFYCNDCDKVILEPGFIRKVEDLIRKEGSNAWWDKSPEEILGKENCKCPHCGSNSLRKETDIMDVWFDSGVSHFAVLRTREELRWPADLYLEGTDQHRGWFQTSLLTSVAVTKKPPYKSVLTHGFIVDGEGRKMSKSLGNVIVPQEVIEKSGADILRMWVASSDYSNDIRISQQILSQLIEAYRRIRNTARFILGNLYDFDPTKDTVAYENMLEIDKWILSRLQYMIDRVDQAYDRFLFHQPYHFLHSFCVLDLSAFYHDVSKDRLYAELPNSIKRRSCQTAMYIILETLTKMLAPLISFTSEEIWQYLRKINPKLSESVFLSDWPEFKEEWRNKELEKKWDKILEIRSSVTKAIELARSDKKVGHSLECTVEVMPLNDEAKSILNSIDKDTWEMILITSGFNITEKKPSEFISSYEDPETKVVIYVKRATGDKCPRCWKYHEKVADLGVCPRCAEVLKLIKGE